MNADERRSTGRFAGSTPGPIHHHLVKRLGIAQSSAKPCFSRVHLRSSAFICGLNCIDTAEGEGKGGREWHFEIPAALRHAVAPADTTNAFRKLLALFSFALSARIKPRRRPD